MKPFQSHFRPPKHTISLPLDIVNYSMSLILFPSSHIPDIETSTTLCYCSYSLDHKRGNCVMIVLGDFHIVEEGGDMP